MRASFVVPPGWTLHPGGPHIALPLLQGTLERHGFDVQLLDCNIGAVAHHGITIPGDAVKTACESGSLERMNELYFGAEDALESIASTYGGTWKAHDGFQRNDCNLGSPTEIREASLLPSPFTKYFKEHAVPELLRFKPALIGVSITVPSQLPTAFELIRTLRSQDYSGFIALGGNVITRIAKDMLLPWVFELINGLVVLQGEQSLLQLLRCIGDRESLSKVPNLFWRENGNFVTNAQATLKPEDFGPPNFKGMPVGNYWGTPYLTMLGSRGCYYGKCSFCAIPYGWGDKRYIGSSPAQQVVDFLSKSIDAYGLKRFKFVEEAIHPKMVQDLAQLVPHMGVEIECEVYARFDRRWLDPWFIEQVRLAGIRKVFLGLELAPGDGRDLLTKSDNADPSVLLHRLGAAGIKTHIFCLFGYPGTGLDDALRTVEFVLDHQEFIDTLDIFPFYFPRYTNVKGIEAIRTEDDSWAIEYPYAPAEAGVLSQAEVHIMAERLSDVVWQEKPEWFHPIYRMYSPWH